MDELPVIDVAPLVAGIDDPAVGAAIDRASREVGFFYVTGHGVDDGLQQRLEAATRALFALPEADKAAVAMVHGGRAWRGWFPLGGELTSGRPDRKEGFYLGEELGLDDPRVQAGTPLHGPNLFPPQVPELRVAVLEYLDAMTALGHAVLRSAKNGAILGHFWGRVKDACGTASSQRLAEPGGAQGIIVGAAPGATLGELAVDGHGRHRAYTDRKSVV